MINDWLQSLSERERRFVYVGAAAVVLMLLFGAVVPLHRSLEATQERVERKRTDLAWMRNVAPQLAAAGPVTAAPTTPQGSIIVVVDRAARESGLGSALTSSEPSGQGGLRVRLDKAPFDIVVGWLARLSEQHGIGVESATVDGTGDPGVVNAGIVLRSR